MSGKKEQTSSYLIESYRPGVSVENLTAAAGRAQHATNEARARGSELRFLGSMLIPADETVFWFFAGDEADVRAVSDRASLSCERVMETVWLPNPEQEGGPIR